MLLVSDVAKQYATVRAVDGVSFGVNAGEVLGLLGPNGAGKTTTIRIILNIIRPDAGTITFDGRPFGDDVRNTIGYLPEERGLYRKSTVLNTILYFASLKGIPVAAAKRKAYDLLTRFDLVSHYNRRIEELSKGNQQKIQFIIAILHDPSLLILDEPFAGLDPINQILLSDIIMELRKAGRAIIFSTHQMDQAEKLCDSICLINHGAIVAKGGLSELKQRYGRQSLRLEFEGDGAFLRTLDGVQHAYVYENYAELVLSPGSSPPELFRTIGRSGNELAVTKFESTYPSLNAIFLDLVGHTAVSGKGPNGTT